jgi:hypothetical protein
MHLRHLFVGGQTTPAPLAQAIAVVAAAVTAGLYYLIGMGVLWVGTSTSSDTTDLGAFGAIVGTVFAVTALLLWRYRSRLLWAAVALLQVVVIIGYVVVSGTRSPAFEAWGVLIKVCQVVLLMAVGYLALRGGEHREAA